MSVQERLEGVQRWLGQGESRIKVLSFLVFLLLVLLVIVIALPTNGPVGEKDQEASWSPWSPWSLCEGELEKRRMRSCQGSCQGQDKTAQTEECPKVVLAAGGYGLSSSLSSVEMLLTPGCSLPSLPLALWGSTAFYTVDNRALVCGGHYTATNSSSMASTTCYQFTNRSWQVFGGPLAREDVWASAAVLRAGVYILGGRNSPGSSEFLPTGSSKWESGPTIPGPGARAACAVSLDSDRFALLGGSLGAQSLVFSSSLQLWTLYSLPSSLQPVDFPDCVLYRGRLLFTGGLLSPSLASSSTWSIDPLTWQGERLGDLGQPRHKHRMMELDGKLLAIGGAGGGGHWLGLSSIEEWDPTSRVWKQAEGSLRQARNGHSFLQLPGTKEEYCQ